jgi:hypothetical protein
MSLPCTATHAANMPESRRTQRDVMKIVDAMDTLHCKIAQPMLPVARLPYCC